MKRFATILVPMALLLAACSGEDTPASSETVATVGTAELDRAQLIELLDSAAANEGYIAALTAQAAQAGITYKVNGEGGPGTYAYEFSIEHINQWIFYTVLEQQVEEQGLKIDDAARRRAEVLASFVFGGQQPPPRSELGDVEPDPAGMEILDAFAPVYRTFFIDGVAAVLVVQDNQANVTDEAIAEYYATNAAQFEQACAAHILISPDPEATDPEAALAAAKVEVDAIAAELAAGGDFAAIAGERSDDPGSGAEGGELGCVPKGQYVPAFDEVVWSIALDTVSEPVQTEFGYHLIKVASRGTATLEESVEQIRSTLEGLASQDFEASLTTWVSEAEVTVDEDYGIWDAVAGTVNPPKGAVVTTTTAALPGLELPEGTIPTGTIPVETAPPATAPATTAAAPGE